MSRILKMLFGARCKGCDGHGHVPCTDCGGTGSVRAQSDEGSNTADDLVEGVEGEKEVNGDEHDYGY